jgi:hypothetical protein
MEALLIINSVLVATTLYFLKDFHGDFKELVKKVGRLEDKVRGLSAQLTQTHPVETPDED